MINKLFLNSAVTYKDKTVFNYFSGSWKELTYGEFLGYTQGIASYLLKSGIVRGDRIAIISENRKEWCASYLAVLMAGGIAVPIDAQSGSGEISNIIAHSGAAAVFHSAGTAGNVSGLVKAVNFDSHQFEDICRTLPCERYPELSDDDAASIIYTSGTTGEPKGVLLTHGNFCSDAEAIISAGILNHEDNVLSVLPLHHAYPFMCTFLVPVFLGAAITCQVGLKGPEMVQAIREKGVTVVVGVPQLLELIRNGIIKKISGRPALLSSALFTILHVCRILRKTFDINMGRLIFSSVHKAFGDRFRFFTSGGARLDTQVMQDLEALGFIVLEGYGLTETAPVVAFNPFEKRKPGSAGKPLPSAGIKIITPSCKGEGEIAIKGPMVMKGYYKNPDMTSRVMQDGWFLSGDLGYIDDEGYLFITGRLKEVLVLSSGKNVYPEEAEREYLKIPLIKEICITAAEANGAAGSIHGAVVPDLDYARQKKIGNIHEALRWAINQVSMTLLPHMRLKGFTLIQESLPRTALGKFKRYKIHEMLNRAAAEILQKEEDAELLSDNTGRLVSECIMPLLNKKMPVHLSDNLELDLGLDSLQRIELIVALEDAVSIKLPDGFASEVQTVGEIVSWIRKVWSKETSRGQIKQEMADIFAAEPSDEEKRNIGLHYGRIVEAVNFIIRTGLRIIFRLCFSLEVKGVEALPPPPFIIAANHCSYMDGFIVSASVPADVFRTLYFQGFQEYFRGKLSSLFARAGHIIPIDSETFLGKALQLSSYILKNNGILCIFPEGGRSFNGDLLEFKKGIGILALGHNAPVVPALIEGTFAALPRGAKWPKFVKVKLKFGKPVYPGDVSRTERPEVKDKYQIFANEIRERIKMLREF